MTFLDLDKIKKVHFVGIGGIGISAIARMMLLEGKEVSGSDRELSSVTEELSKLGARIYDKHSDSNILSDIDLVVYSIAVPEDNPELKVALSFSIPLMSYPEILGLVSKNKYTIAVSGTHGKTTTTAMIAKVFVEAKKDPTVIVGSFLKDKKSNFIAGKSRYFVVEACEYRRSFLNLSPRILVITNIDNDHLDYYGDLDGVVKAFREFAEKLTADDFLVCNASDKNIKQILPNLRCEIVDYAEVSKNLVSKLSLKIPGKHNVENAKAVLAVSNILGINGDIAVSALNDFSGTWRRFEYKGKTASGAFVYDDYGHHPTEIKATLQGAREMFKENKIIVVFQPHLYSRTKILLDDFAKSFYLANEVILAPIYAARETSDPMISSEILAKEISKNNAITRVKSMNNFREIEAYLLSELKKDDVLITMGAGEANKISDKLVL